MFKSFNLIKELYFERTGGSAEEHKAANIIKAKIEELNGVVSLEAFQVDGYHINKASLVIDDNTSIECAGVGLSSSTLASGIKKEFTYITSLEDAKIQNVEDKICLIHSRMVNNLIYEVLIKKHASGLILCSGDVYVEAKYTDIAPYMYREIHYKWGKIPAVCIRMKDAEKLIQKKPKYVHLTILQDEFKNESYNVVSEIKGTVFPNEIIALTAHYDSVSFSKGAYDNASGSSALYHLFEYFMKNPPKRTLKFIWCGSEEMGLLGSKAYVLKHNEELSKYLLCINIDMLGATLGYDIACVTGEMSFVHYLKYISREDGFALNVSQGVYSSDSTPFADKGIPAVSFARISPQGGAQIHSRNDVLDHLSKENYYHSCKFITSFAERLANSAYFPVDQSMPDNMKEELDYYLKRKERK